MASARGEDVITVPAAARLLGLTPHSIYRLMEEGELGHVQVYELTASGRMRRRRSFDLTRKDVYDFIEQARVQPGTLSHLCASPTSPPELELRIIDRFVRRLTPPPARRELRLEMTKRGTYVTLWERRLLATEPRGQGSRMAIAQLRYEPPTGTWTLFWAEGKTPKWRAWGPGGEHVALRDVLQIIETDSLDVFFG